MAKISIDLSEKVKPMKPMHGGGQPPMALQFDYVDTYHFTHMHYLTEIGVPYSRLHDVGGPFGAGKYVDIPNIFRDFDADENDPESYDFTFTDFLLENLVEAGVEPYYRLGVTIENQCLIKKYFTYPPKDYAKWARICEHIIMHYNEGWADGYHFGITYWEIWNEPDLRRGELWAGTDEEYFRLYEVASKHLKKRFGDSIKVGGYGSVGFYAIAPDKNNTPPNDDQIEKITFFESFMEYIKKTNAPIDFFSWHSYATPDRIVTADNWLDNKLKEYGYEGLETHVNEWNPRFADNFGTANHAAEATATMLAMQCGHPQVMCIYDMRCGGGIFSAFFDLKTFKPVQTYYGFAAFNKLYQLGTQVKHTCDTEDVYAVCASDGKKGALLISNVSGEDHELTIEGIDLTNARYSVIDETRMLSWAPNADVIENDMIVLIEFDC